MKTEFICTETRDNVKKTFLESLLQSTAVVLLASFFSTTLERKVNSLQALHLLHAHLSFSSLLLFGGLSVLIAVVLFVWFAVSVYQCARALK